MFGGGKVTRWTRAALLALARQKLHDAIREGHGDYAKTMTREVMRLTIGVAP